MTTTQTAKLAERLRRYCRDVRESEPLRRHVTFRIGGPADILLVPRSVDELRSAAVTLFQERIPFTVLGAGSNVLIADAGIRGVVIKIGKGLDRVAYDGATVVAEAGAGLPHLAREAAKCGLAGLEFAAGIPASVGGAAVMNAGAHGHDMQEVVRAVRVVMPAGESVLDSPALQYGYRTSILQRLPAVVLQVTMQLRSGDAGEIKQRTEEWLRHRGETQPVGPPSSGCVFRNPAGDHAGRLIDLAGAKGWARGGARVSELHANYILNTGEATAADVVALMDKVSALVMEKFGTRLEPEIKFVGEFPAQQG